MKRTVAAHGKKLQKEGEDDVLLKQKTVSKSATDPDNRLFPKGEWRKGFASEVHTACDWHCYVVEMEATSGNVYDSTAFDTVFEKLNAQDPEVQVNDGSRLQNAQKLQGNHGQWKKLVVALQATDDEEREFAVIRVCA